LTLLENDHSLANTLDLYDTKILACGLSKFYYGHISALLTSKTEKRAIVSSVSELIGWILYCQKYRQDASEKGILVSANDQIR
jgi:hypothetical protein